MYEDNYLESDYEDRYDITDDVDFEDNPDNYDDSDETDDSDDEGDEPTIEPETDNPDDHIGVGHLGEIVEIWFVPVDFLTNADDQRRALQTSQFGYMI